MAKRVRKKKPVVNVTADVHNRLTEDAKRFNTYFPHCYLLGMDKDGVVTETARITIGKGNGGCECMPTLYDRYMAKAAGKLKGTPCGVARVGDSFNVNADKGADSGLSDLGQLGLFMISYNRRSDYISVDKRVQQGKMAHKYRYGVVPNKRKEVKTNGNNKRKTRTANRPTKSIKSKSRNNTSTVSRS